MPQDVRLRSFFSYFGSKNQISGRYHPPEFETLVEPFAGAAGYSLRHYKKQVKLFDLDPVICSVWKYLIEEATPDNIMALPSVFDCSVGSLDVSYGAQNLIGFWLGRGQSSPLKRPGPWMRSGQYGGAFWGRQVQERIATQLPAIEHWQINDPCSYEAINVEKYNDATWFIDPPYEGQGKGTTYSKGNVGFPFPALANWCKNDLKGQIIICENDGAEWLKNAELDVEHLVALTGTHKKPSTEVVCYLMKRNGRQE